jgi:magnesium-protoporphyrin IX monomethyl ester (oxidative) cyclase
MFLGFESLNAQQLQLFRKRITPNQNFQALDVARKLGIDVAINLITDPNWEEKQFREARDWATDVPEIVHLTVATPYPGTELFHAQSHDWITTDYRLFDIQHAVTRTRMPLSEFYRSLVETQSLIHRKFMGWRTAVSVAQILAGHLLHGQTNFLRMLFKFEKFYNADRFFQDHSQPVRYSLRLPVPEQLGLTGRQLQIHHSTA